MSVFSVIKRGRQQAKEQAKKEKEKKAKEAQQPAYKHVPTHAAQDALAGAPPTWRMEDRPRILEQNRRRSAMAASGMNMNMPGPPAPGPHRASSALSNVMYPAAHANPMVGMSRSHSDYGAVPRWPYRHGEAVVYATPDPPYVPNMPGSSSPKAKEVDRASMYGSRRASSSLGKGNASVSNSDNSSSSQEELDVKSPKPVYGGHQSGISEGLGGRMSTTATTVEMAGVHRLHPSRSRRSSDASERRSITSEPQGHNPSSQSQGSPRDSRPPLSMRGFNAIPAQAQYIPPPRNLPGDLTHPPSSVGSSAASTRSATEVSLAMSLPSQATGASSPPSAGSPTRMAQQTPITPSSTDFVFPFASPTVAGPAQSATSARRLTDSPPRPGPVQASTQPAAARSGAVQNPPTAKPQERRNSRPPRFNELETIESHTSSTLSAQSAPARPPLTRKYSAPPQASHNAISQELGHHEQPEAVADVPLNTNEAKSKGKLTKARPAKPSKKNRWSLGSRSSQVVLAS